MSNATAAGATRVVIEDTGFGLRAAVLEDEDRLVELRDQDHVDDRRRVTDELFLARVSAVDAKLNAAFLDCGLPEPGFVAAKDARAAAGGGGRRPIRELLREGQKLIVQGLREAAADDKGPRFTTDVRLFGFALVHTPLNAQAAPEGGGGGRREADALRARAAELFPDGTFALRSIAAEAPDEILRAEAGALAAKWRAAQAAATAARRPGRLPAPERPLERLLRGLLAAAPERIEVADTALWAELRRLAERAPGFPPAIELVRLPDDRPAFASAGVDEELEVALSADVPLAGGGRLRFERTAAFTTVDVDGGGREPLDANLTAVPELARQVRLRNLGGTIAVDFVTLARRQEQQRLEDALRRAFRRDPVPVDVHSMPALGLVAISRARRGEPLSARFLRPCPGCGGAGEVPGLRLQAERLLAELRGRTLPPAEVRVAADLQAFLGGEAGDPWRAAAARLGPVPALRADPALEPGGFAVGG